MARFAYSNKIDPLLLNDMTQSTQDVNIVVVSRNYESLIRDLHELHINIISEYSLLNGVHVCVPKSKLTTLAALRSVSLIMADLMLSTQMNIARRVLNVAPLHRAGLTGKGIGIAIVDTGIYPHPDFIRPHSRILAFKDVIGGKENPYDDNGHGTFVAGVAAGNGYMSKGKYMGIAPNANIIAVRAMDGGGVGATTTVIKGLQWIANNASKYGIRIISLSIGTSPGMMIREDAMVRAVEALWKRGVVVIAAAGNNGPKYKTITVPGVSDMIITVGAMNDKRTITTDDDDVPEFSSRGPVGKYIKPDIIAPGVEIIATRANDRHNNNRQTKHRNGYVRMTGTSVATPMVAGAAALILQRYPNLSPIGVKTRLLNGAKPLINQPLLEGRGVMKLS